ncbi:MAG: hypothetical protein RLZZ230_526 [Candidatus Parcubacteria bacterium]|jgi:uncharacterized membrane protein
MSSLDTEEKTFTTLFLLSMWWRIGYGLLRIILGLALLRVIGEPLINIVTSVMEHELMAKSPDFIFKGISHSLRAHHYSVTYFLAFYFIFWGSVDAVLSFQLLKDRLWAFPISLGLIGTFIAYSVFRFTYTHSLVLLGVIVLDIIIMMLIFKEYQKVLKLRSRSNQTTQISQ